jgi:hypothetical protein
VRRQSEIINFADKFIALKIANGFVTVAIQYAVRLFTGLADRLRAGMCNNSQGDVAACIARLAKVPNSLRLRAYRVRFEILTGCPIFSVTRTGYEVDAFVAGWEVQSFADVRRHLA